MKTMSDQERNIPKTVAVFMIAFPPLAFRTGFVYLRTKRRARRGAKRAMKGMIEQGVPPEMAKRLANEYEERLSLRNMIHKFAPGAWGGRPARPM